MPGRARTRYTPGPWTVAPYDNTDLAGVYRVWEAQERLTDAEGAEDETAANVRLISAAPALARVLRKIAGGGRPGYPDLLTYYHDPASCEPAGLQPGEGCFHCLLVREATAALRQVDGP